MNEQFLQQHKTLLEQVKEINPIMAGYYTLRRYTWPAAMMQRIALFLDYGATMEHPTGYAVSLFSTPPTREKMLDFVTQLHIDSIQQSTTYRMCEQVFTRTGIHVVDFSKPFEWTQKQNNARISLIADVAKYAHAESPKAAESFNLFITVHNQFVRLEDQEMLRALNRIRTKYA